MDSSAVEVSASSLMPKLDVIPAIRGCSLSSEQRIKCFYLLYNPSEDDSPILKCVALNKESGETNELTITPAPDVRNPLPFYINFTAVALGSTIYIIGGFRQSNRQADGSVRFFDVLRPEDGWREAAPMNIPRPFQPTAASIDGKIYVLGGTVISDPNDGECFDPKTNKWVCFPCAGNEAAFPYLQSLYVGPDGAKSILVHSDCDKGALHAYILAKQKWELISRDFSECIIPGAVVGDIIYTLLDGRDQKGKALHGYHLVHKKWIPVDFDPEREILSTRAWVIASGSDRLCVLWFRFHLKDAKGKHNIVECLELRLDKPSYSDPGSETPHLSASIVSRTYFRLNPYFGRLALIAL